MDFPYKPELNSGQILTGSGVDLDLVSGLNEQRNVNNCTSLNGCRFGSTCCGITFEARLSICDLKLYKQRSLYCKYIAVVRTYLYHLVLLNELQRITDGLIVQSDLIVVLCIHEVVQISVIVQILHLYAVNSCSREFLRRTEGLLYNTAVDDIFNLFS